MNRIAILLFAWTAPLLGQVNPDLSSRITRPFPVSKRGRETTIEAREILLQLRNQQGKTVKANVFTLFDPDTKLFLWFYVENWDNVARVHIADSRAARDKAYATTDRLVLIEPDPGQLRIWEAIQRASSIDDAEEQTLRALNAQARIPRVSLWWSSPPKAIELPTLPSEFYIPPGYAAPRRGVRVVSIVPVSEGLEVTSECEWQESIVLSPRYEVLKTARVEWWRHH